MLSLQKERSQVQGGQQANVDSSKGRVGHVRLAHPAVPSSWLKGVPECLACSWVMQDMEWLRLIGVGPESTTSLPSMPCWVTPCWHCHSEMAAQAYLVRSNTQDCYQAAEIV